MQQEFYLRFQGHFRAALAAQRSTAESFGPTWEKTMLEVPLGELNQAIVYWELIRWAKEADLFTTPGPSELFSAWKETVHEL